MDFDKLMEYQNMVQKNLQREQQLDRKIELLTIINQLTIGKKNNRVQTEMVLLATQEHGMSTSEVERLLDQLVDEHIIDYDGEGYIRRK